MLIDNSSNLNYHIIKQFIFSLSSNLLSSSVAAYRGAIIQSNYTNCSYIYLNNKIIRKEKDKVMLYNCLINIHLSHKLTRVSTVDLKHIN